MKIEVPAGCVGKMILILVVVVLMFMMCCCTCAECQGQDCAACNHSQPKATSEDLQPSKHAVVNDLYLKAGSNGDMNLWERVHPSSNGYTIYFQKYKLEGMLYELIVTDGSLEVVNITKDSLEVELLRQKLKYVN